MYACVCDWLGFSYREEVQWVSEPVCTHFWTHAHTVTFSHHRRIFQYLTGLFVFIFPPLFIFFLISSFLRLHKNLPVSLSNSLCISLASLIISVCYWHNWIIFQIGCRYNLSDTRYQGIEFTRLQSSWPQVSYVVGSFLSAPKFGLRASLLCWYS